MSESIDITLPPPTAPGIDPSLSAGSKILEKEMLADKWMNSLNGEFITDNASVGFKNKPKKEGKPSEDAAYVYSDKNGVVYLGAFDGLGHYGNGDLMAKIAREVLHTNYAVKNMLLTNPGGLSDDVYPDIVDTIKAVKDADPTSIDGESSAVGVFGVLVEVDDVKRFVGAGVGDCLGHVVRANGEVIELNKEESVRQEMLDSGFSETEADKHGHEVTNRLAYDFDGVNQKFDIEVFDGDIILLTTDGITGDKASQRLSGGSSNEEVIRMVALDKSLTPKQRAEKLVELATKDDDRTVVLVEVGNYKNSISDLESSAEAIGQRVQKGVGGIALGTELEGSPELAPKTRDDKLFAPLLDLEYSSGVLSEEDNDMYGKLVYGTDDEAEGVQTGLENNMSSRERGFRERSRVTKESLDSASRELMSLKYKDPIINDILTKFQSENNNVYGDELLKAIRVNPELRKAIGSRLRDLSEANAYSVRTGIGTALKKVDAPGYELMPPRMTSKEYVGLLMLAMIDGSYKENPSDPIIKDNFGSVITGNHRSSARSILRSVGSLSTITNQR